MAATQEYDDAEHYKAQYLQQRADENDELLPLGMNIAEQARSNYVGMARTLRRMKERRAHPHWTVPVEGLLIVMLQRRVLRPERTTGLGMVQEYLAPQFEQRFMGVLVFARRSGWLPLSWHRSAIYPVDKGNCDSGPAGIRSLHGFGPAAMTWYGGHHMRTAPKLQWPHWATGAVPEKSREEAITTQLAGMWRLE